MNDNENTWISIGEAVQRVLAEVRRKMKERQE